ncbi:ribosomal protein L35Ae [Lentithecium fluviatile CBS 122367]|uniref:Ribosomal protein L35Ae n=1 Tax=Lentithecium fluviatile CBS 122367 TaxID=1168545 RepID=A0A6G1JL21_9PLEO|nr:ribosomal protein L35Ae [Lentithecium fluviatile CBS 122367]
MADAQSHRLYVKARHVGYQRGKRNTNPNVSLLTLDGVSNTEEAKWYLGKRAAFVYRAPKTTRGTKIRVIWGKIRSTHGNSGIVRASFKNNLPPRSFGAAVRVMMYPSAA